MKTIWTLIFLLVIPLFVSAQNNQIEQLIEEVKTLDGAEFIEKAILLSDLFYQQNRYQEAEGTAIHAYRKAEQLQDLEGMAKALNREGKAISQQKSPKNSPKLAVKFIKSNQLLREAGGLNTNLQQDNLSQLRTMAQGLNRNRDLNQLESQIEQLRNSPNPVTANDTLKALGELMAMIDEKNLRPKQQKVLQKIKDVYQKDQKSKAALESAKLALEKEADKLSMEREELSEGLIKQQEAIAKMTAEQMQNELLLTKIRKQSDSLIYLQQLDSISLAEKDAQLREQQAVLAQQKIRRNLNLALTGIILIIALGLYSRYQGQKKHNLLLAQKNEIIKKEKERSDALLLNILPAAIANELKLSGKAQARHHPSVSVLFTDFINFSKISEQLSPQELVKELDYCFKAFDNIIIKYDLEKIKTIGDAYMCAGGLTREQENHAEQIIKAALEIQQWLDQWKEEKLQQRKPYFEARIGVHSGPIVAGVVGLKKFAYDIWGDTVNVAARLESKGAAGKVNISGDTYELIKNRFECEYRGKVAAKNKGEIDMYYVNGN